MTYVASIVPKSHSRPFQLTSLLHIEEVDISVQNSVLLLYVPVDITISEERMDTLRTKLPKIILDQIESEY